MELEDMDLEAITPRQVRQYLKDKFVIVASNRGPVEFRTGPDGVIKPHRGAGGVVTAMSTALVATDAVWISTAKSPEDVDMARKAPGRRLGLPPDRPQYWVRYIAPDKEDFNQYYNIISNSILWPMQHYLFDVAHKPNIDEAVHKAWSKGYRKVNQLFAEEILREIKSTDKKPLIFLQDYHLYLCAQYIRRRRPDVLIHHFTHSPWTQPDYLRFLPQGMRKELLQGMLANDVLGFHTPHYANNFLQCCREGEAVRVAVDSKRRMVRFEGREVFVKHYPISIDHDALEKLATRADVTKNRESLRAMIGDRKLLLRVDRLEPSKNILRGLCAYECFLKKHPEWQKKVVFVNLLYPSREDLQDYRDLRKDTEQKAAELNRQYGSDDWEPVHLDISDDYPRSVAGLIEFDALLVNPVADGMNLVAKEGAVLNSREGLIILSVTAGAYQEMRGSVFAVNPLDIEETAQAIWKSLETTARKRKMMAKSTNEVVEANTSFKWFLLQMRALRKVEKQRAQKLPEHDDRMVTPRYESFE